MAALRCFPSYTCSRLPTINCSLTSYKACTHIVNISRSNSQSSSDEQNAGDRSFFSKLLDINVGGSFAPKAAHSKVLSEGSVIYELQVDHVKPDCVLDYKNELSDIFPKIHNNEDLPCKLIGSWTTQFGKLDQAVHLWTYTGGYKAVSQAKKLMATDPELSEFARRKSNLLRHRENQLLNSFHFWGEPQTKESDKTSEHIYELRSYSLKPGTMIEWGNNWGRAIKIRQKHAVGGFFSQIGELYQVHHIWAYRDLAHRKEARELMWQVPGWDDCVANTVPLVNNMESRLLVPYPFSPLQ